jgi:hypothetical protein
MTLPSGQEKTPEVTVRKSLVPKLEGQALSWSIEGNWRCTFRDI